MGRGCYIISPPNTDTAPLPDPDAPVATDMPLLIAMPGATDRPPFIAAANPSIRSCGPSFNTPLFHPPPRQSTHSRIAFVHFRAEADPCSPRWCTVANRHLNPSTACHTRLLWHVFHQQKVRLQLRLGVRVEHWHAHISPKSRPNPLQPLARQIRMQPPNSDAAGGRYRHLVSTTETAIASGNDGGCGVLLP